LGAAAGSTVIHVVALLGLIRGEAPAIARGSWQIAAPPPQQPEWIDVVALDDPANPSSAPPPPAPVAPARRDLSETVADQAHRPLTTSAPRVAEGRSPEAAAADAGLRAGRTTDAAWRRDRSTLHASLSDGAARSQTPRSDTGARPASPEATRSEPTVGAGDAIRSLTPSSPPSASQPSPEQEEPEGDLARAAPGAPEHQRVLAVAEVTPPGAAAQPVRGVGPLDAEQGPRSFDTETPGPAADQSNQRSASSELHPGLTDLARAGVRSRDQVLSGQGPGDAPGAVDRAARGRAAAEYGGGPRAQSVGAEVTERTRERVYDQYYREIRRRVGTPVFPKRLQLQLEQGETIVHFMVDADGRVRGGIHVSKSSGFDEFDAEATRAVERAAPFPPLPPGLSGRPLPVSIAFAFENPLIR
jgi:protein TonB